MHPKNQLHVVHPKINCMLMQITKLVITAMLTQKIEFAPAVVTTVVLCATIQKKQSRCIF